MFDEIVNATKNICHFELGRDNCSPGFKNPSTALKMGYAMKKMAVIERGVVLRKRDEAYRNDLWYFIELITSEWAQKISKVALNTLVEASFNKVEEVPLTEDLINLKKYLEKEMTIHYKELKFRPTLVAWRALAALTVVRIILFNKRRSSKGAKMKVKQFEERPKWNEERIQEIMQSIRKAAV